MKNKKFFSLLALMLAVMMLAAGCAGGASSDSQISESSQEALPSEEIPAGSFTMNIGFLKGPTGMGAASLMEQDSVGETAVDYTFTVAGAPDVLVSQLISGELDAAALPSNSVAAVYQKTNQGVQVVAVNTLGVLYVMEKGDSIQSVADLRGKTILSSGQGTTAEYAFNYILAQNGLVPGTDLTVEYASEHSEVATKALAGDYDVVLLPEPFVTSLSKQSADFRTALSLPDEWAKVCDAPLAMGVVAVRSDYIAANPGAVEAFLSEYALSVQAGNDNPAAAAQLCEKYDVIAAAVAESAIPRSNMVCLTGAEMKAALTAFYNVLFESNPASIGGALPDDNFYFGA